VRGRRAPRPEFVKGVVPSVVPRPVPTTARKEGSAARQGRRAARAGRLATGLAAALVAADGADALDLGDAVDARMRALYPADEPGAVVLVARGEQVLARGAWGLADLEHAVPLIPEAVFEVASVAKLFTAAAALILVDEGELGLEDGVADVLPAHADAGITVRHLLAHASGLPEYLDRPDARAWIRSELELDELVASFAARPLDFAPGGRSAYSNSNYVVLAALVERASGREYARFLRERVFEPAGMTHTRCGGRSAIVPHRARGYELDDGGFRNEKYYSPTVLTGAGGVLSTADDLVRFLRALFAGELVSAEQLAHSTAPARLASGEPTRFGLGWELARAGGRRAVLKGGALSGFTHYVLALPAEQLYVVVLTNRPADERRRPGLLALELAELALR